MASPSLRRTDPDIGLHFDDLSWVARGHNLEPEGLVNLTLSGMQGFMIRDLGPHSQPGWWLRSRVAGHQPTAGPMFCPQCLSEDKEPFFRLHWRFGFITSCPVHDIELLEQCPRCHEPVWPRGAGIIGRLSERFESLKHCWGCGLELSGAERRAAVADIDRALLQGLQKGSMVIGDVEYPAVEVLEALRGICQIFVRNKTRKLLLESDWSEKHVLQRLSSKSLNTRSVELMHVCDRRNIVPLAWSVVSDWPHSFRRFCTDSGLGKWHLNGASQLHPAWMNKEIEGNLAKQNRRVTKALLNQTFNDLQQSLGRPPFKGELRRALDWQGSKHMDGIYQRRAFATTEERQQFLSFAEQEMLRRSDRRLSLFHAVVDTAVIALCMLEHKHLEELCIENAQTLQDRVSRQSGIFSPDARRLIELIRDTLRTYPSARKLAYVPKLRQIRKRFVLIVDLLKADLLKSVSTYWLDLSSLPVPGAEANPWHQDCSADGDGLENLSSGAES